MPILEGGGIEVDGQGTAIITESCVLNARRKLQRVLGIDKVIAAGGGGIRCTMQQQQPA